MRPVLGEVLHFSEDPDITEFVPHVARTATDQTPYVWAVDAVRAPDYWFPRDCPRAMAWLMPSTTETDRLMILGPSATRVHMIEYEWLQRVQSARVFAYRFDAGDFEPYGHSADPHAYVARRHVCPLSPPEPVGDLLTLHRQAGIEVRLVDSLWPWWTAVTTTSVGFSGIRLGNARDATSRPTS
jgi:hypothetical protein